MNRKTWILASVCFPVILFDYWSKALVHGNFRPGESISLVEHFFSLTYVRNYGAAFGFLSRAPESFREPFFFLMPIAACICVVLIYARLKDQETGLSVSLSLILGGALGNLLSRARYGYVVDFLDLHWKDVYHWPAFNLADCSIVVAVTLIVLRSWRAEHRVASKAPIGHQTGQLPTL